MDIRTSFPSKYLRASDIPEGKQVRVTIDRVQVENVAGNDDPDAEKPVLFFEGKSKGMVLNKTNAGTISAAYGDETEDWAGKAILIYASETQFQGKTMPCLRVRVDRGAARPAAVGNGARRVAEPVAARTGARDEFPATDEVTNQADMGDVPF